MSVQKVARLMVESEDRSEREGLYLLLIEFHEQELRAERRYMREAVESVSKTLKEYNAAVARIHGRKYTDAEKNGAVAAVARLLKKTGMSPNSAVINVSKTTGIPRGTLRRWVSEG